MKRQINAHDDIIREISGISGVGIITCSSD
jgi:hypothetical protein